MRRRLWSVFALCVAAAGQDRPRVPDFPPDVIVRDSPIRDLAKLDTRHVRVDEENDRVRVLRIVLGAGESLPMHDARNGVLVCLTACRLSVVNPVGYTFEITLGAGRTQWMEAKRHRILNTGEAAEMLYIEAKQPVTSK
ncbi:MAG: hypothetical protein KGN36_20130 [Acidobacteriota bacterium]|nr:hypothetical protein [Acidobacteriota bacterium]